MRTTLLGSLLDSVRHNTARGNEDVRLFEEGSVYFDRPHGRELTAAEAALDAAAGRAHAPRRADDRPPAPAVVGRAVAAERRLLRRQGRAGDAAGRVARRRSPSSAAPTRSCIRAARRACWSRARTPAGSASCTRASRASGTSARSRASSSTSARCSRTPTSSPLYEDLTSFPVIRQDLAFWIPADRTAAELVEVVRGAGGKLLRDVRVFDVYAREGQTSRGRAARVPRDRPHADRRGDRAAARQDRQGGGRASWRGSCVASVAVLGAAGYAGAIAAQLLYKHPFFELVARDRARRGGAAARRRAPAHAGAAGARGLRRRRPPTRRSSPTRTGRRRRSWPSCATAACASSISPRTSGCATRASTRTGTASTARRSTSGRASTGCRS